MQHGAGAYHASASRIGMSITSARVAEPGENQRRSSAGGRAGPRARATGVSGLHGRQRCFGADVFETQEGSCPRTAPGPVDADVHADSVFFETSDGGAVSSTGSIDRAESRPGAGQLS